MYAAPVPDIVGFRSELLPALSPSGIFITTCLTSVHLSSIMLFVSNTIVIPCAVLALFIHPSTSHNLINRIFWAFCVYLEAVSVLPQLQVMQNTKIVEPFTAHYVFALGVARFLSCAHWVLQVLDSRGHLLVALGYGLWPSMVLISEICIRRAARSPSSLWSGISEDAVV
ncbi:hypothetical protein Gotri_015507 [Gossypium trilobum]|uniref:ER lumen protein-retaining receptor n=1 Tax=Gossypium trilobum TaxID=34281 RepID=A0A7J9E0B9_9ROSI|nr:hypothetical protein [Gossypium trilobum]